MRIDDFSLAFNCPGCPSWGTAIVNQDSKKIHLIKKDVASNIVIGMMHKCVTINTHDFSLPIGKGSRVYYGNTGFDGATSEPMLVSVFDKVSINGISIPAPFVMAIIRDKAEAHKGRLQIKYTPKLKYGTISNEHFFEIAEQTLKIKPDTPWVIYDIDVAGQEELRFNALIGEDIKDLESQLRNLPQIDDTSIFNSQLSIEPVAKSLSFGSFLPRQIIYYGAPGTGKSHTIKKEEDAGKIVCIRTTFHPDSDYATFVGCYKPHKCKETGNLTYEFVEQAFLSAYRMAWMNPAEEIALVIEEINRGNCAQVFGDIFQLLDRDEDGWSTYPIKADTDICDYLEEQAIPCYSETMVKKYGEGKAGYGYLALPPNLSILATMNTSDQSLFPIDSAFKRRWDWRYIPICQGRTEPKEEEEKGELLDWKIETSAEKRNWWDFLRAINGIIESTTHSEDKELGFFFCKADEKGVISADKFVNKVVFYLWTDVFKTYGFRSDIFNKDEEGKVKLSFKDFFNQETGEPNMDTVKLFVENVMKHLPKDEAQNG